jgi:hypothetical protein
MEIKKTYVFIKYNPYTGMGGESFPTAKVYQCLLEPGGMSSSPKYLYFRAIGPTLALITEKELHELQNKNEEALKKLKEIGGY